MRPLSRTPQPHLHCYGSEFAENSLPAGNSWAETWGEEGFVYVTYGSNVCGLTYQATTVSVEKVA